MNQYIITEPDVAKLEYHNPYGSGADIAERCRSHPYNPQAEQCVYWGIKEGKYCCAFLIPDPDLYVELTDKIKQAEREKVLDELVEKLKLASQFDRTAYIPANVKLTVLVDTIKMVEELRQEGKQEQP